MIGILWNIEQSKVSWRAVHLLYISIVRLGTPQDLLVVLGPEGLIRVDLYQIPQVEEEGSLEMECIPLPFCRLDVSFANRIS